HGAWFERLLLGDAPDPRDLALVEDREHLCPARLQVERRYEARHRESFPYRGSAASLVSLRKGTDRRCNSTPTSRRLHPTPPRGAWYAGGAASRGDSVTSRSSRRARTSGRPAGAPSGPRSSGNPRIPEAGDGWPVASWPSRAR